MNKAAQALGRRAKGVPKNFDKATVAALTKRLADARKKRWVNKQTKGKAK